MAARWTRYDRDEVDRHLELVSERLTSTDVGQALVHRRRELEERERAVAAREAEQARLALGVLEKLVRLRARPRACA